MSFKNETGHFQVPMSYTKAGGDDTTKQLKLFYQRWVPENPKPGCNVVIHHGLGEHSSRYGNLLSTLEGTGITIYSYDLRGHGHSEGAKGLAKDVYQLAQDLNVYLDFLHKEYRVTQPLLYGHSMGGATSLAFVGQGKEYQGKVKALVITGPALGVDKNCYQTTMFVLLTCLKSIIPNVCLPSGLDIKNLSHDQNYVEAYHTDPMTHDLIAISLAFSLLGAGPSIIETAPTMTLPIFMGHGEDDIICAPYGTKNYFEACGSTQKTLKLYPGLCHEIHNETKEEREKVLADIKEFIVANV
jgi:acylglycerol lipase